MSGVHTAIGRSALRIALAVVLIAFCVRDLRGFLRGMERRLPTLKRWLPQARALGSEERFYEAHPDYLYPPAFLVLIRPLAELSQPAAAVIWQVSKYLSLVVIFGLSWRLAGAGDALPLWLRIASVIMSLRFFVSDLGHGNINIFITLGVVTGLWCLASGRPLLCGLLVAVVASLKVTPALFAVYLAYRRQWRACVGFAVGATLMLGVVPLAVLTPRQNAELLRQWYDHVVRGYAASGAIYSPGMNQSLAAVTNRLLGRTELGPPDERPWVLASPDPRVVTWIQRAVAAGLLGLLAWSCRGEHRPGDSLPLMMDWSMVAATTLVLSGYTWTGHLTLLIPAHVALLAYLRRTASRDQLDRWVLGLTLASFALASLTGDLLTRAGRERMSSLGSMLWGTMTVIAALAVAGARLRDARSSAHREA